MILIREATEHDIESIAELFKAVYGDYYAHPEFHSREILKKLIYNDDTLILVAEDEETKRILGTGSVILDFGAFGDLLGEFGRLVVHPDGRRQGIGNKLMEARLEAVRDRLHIAIVENRAAHPFSQRISDSHGFSCAGFLPCKVSFEERESIAYYARHFGDAIKLRRNHPHLIPEAYELADQVLRSCGVTSDAIIDAESPAYQGEEDYVLGDMTSRGYTSLLRFERGRVSRREVFGPVKLHVGLFQLHVSDYRYVLARRGNRLVGGLGFHIDRKENAARLLELVSADDGPIRSLLATVTKRCLEDEGIGYIEADVNAYSPRMQRTFLELGYLPVAYVPAMAFHRVERLDAVRMARLANPPDISNIQLHEASKPIAEIVIRQFQQHEVAPRLAEAAPANAIFNGLNPEQTKQLAATCALKVFKKGERLVDQGAESSEVLLILSGSVSVTIDQQEVGVVRVGESLGEISLIQDTPHAASATALEPVESAALGRAALESLVRRRPDIGLILFRNLARQLGKKLLRADKRMMNAED